MAETVKLRSGWVLLAGVFAVTTVGTLGLVVAEMRYVSEQLVAVQEHQESFDRQLSAERARTSSAGMEARALAAEARERAAAERVARLEAAVQRLEERAGKPAASSKPEPPQPVTAPVPAVTPTPRARPSVKAPRLAAGSAGSLAASSLAASSLGVASAPAAASSSATAGRASAPSKAPGTEDELAPRPTALVKPFVARKPEPTPASQPKLFAEPTPSQPLADRRLGL